jgi:hypothetical protein
LPLRNIEQAMSLLRSTLARTTLATLIFLVASCVPTPHATPKPAPLPSPATRAERSGYHATSTDSDVTQFLSILGVRAHRLDSAGHRDPRPNVAPIDVAAYDSSRGGRLIPFVLAARPTAMSAQEAHRLGRPVVFVEAGATGTPDGAGTDALLAVLRDLLGAKGTTPNVLDSIVLVAVPLANPDATHPGGGATAAPDTDLVALTAQETRTTMAVLHAWRPDVIIDLRSVDAGHAAYPLTLAPSLAPAALFTGPYTRDTLLPELRHRLANDHIETFPCGAVVPAWPKGGDTTAYAYASCDHRARVLTNYVGLGTRIGILARTNTSDSLATQVHAAATFLRETLALIAEHGAEIAARGEAADTTVEAWAQDPASGPAIPLRATAATDGPTLPVMVAAPTDTGCHPHLMPVQAEAVPTVRRRLAAAYIVPAEDSTIARLLGRHGIAVQRHAGDLDAQIVERFVIDSARVDSTHVDGTHPPQVEGHWLRVIAQTKIPAGSYIVPLGQPLGILAMSLLDPESDDGFVTWHRFDRALHPGGTYPVSKLIY